MKTLGILVGNITLVTDLVVLVSSGGDVHAGIEFTFYTSNIKKTTYMQTNVVLFLYYLQLCVNLYHY